MRQNNTVNIRKAKEVARRKYAERQINKFIKWSVDQRGFLRYKDVVKKHNEYNIKVYG